MDLVAELIEDIREAFKGVSRGYVTLHEADVIDDYGTPEQRIEARKLDREGSWDRVPDADIERFHWVLSFFDTQSWKYYLPAYMVWALKNFRESWSTSVDTTSVNATIYSLLPEKKSDDVRALDIERYNTLDYSQAQCVTRFLRFMSLQGFHADARNAGKALSDYWKDRVDELEEAKKPEPKIKRKIRPRSR